MSRRKFNLTWKQAFAEIFLIFIGITLAVTFQNFNDNRKDEKLRQGYYQRLYSELKQDANDLTGISGYHQYRVDLITEFFDYLDQNNPPDPDSIQSSIQFISYHMNSYVPNESTYRELISTGNIKLMETGIRERLLRLSQMHTYVVETELGFDQRYNNRRDQMAEVIDEASFYKHRNNPDPRLLRWQRDINSEGFLRYSNLLAVRLTIANTLIDMYSTLRDMCDELTTLIEAEIED